MSLKVHLFKADKPLKNNPKPGSGLVVLSGFASQIDSLSDVGVVFLHDMVSLLDMVSLHNMVSLLDMLSLHDMGSLHDMVEATALIELEQESCKQQSRTWNNVLGCLSMLLA